MIQFGSDTRKRMIQGAITFAKAVSTTYGPKGRNVVLDRAAGILSTKDGVTVAREIFLKDPIENMGAQILKQACLRVNEKAGDGTTSAAIISAALLIEGFKNIEAGYDPVSLIRELDQGFDKCYKALPNMRSKDLDYFKLYHVSKIASNGDEVISKYLAEATMDVGDDGTITIEEGRGLEVEKIYCNGMEYQQNILNEGFLKKETERIIVKPLVAVVGEVLTKVSDIQDILECASQWPQNTLLLFCDDIQGEALDTVLTNDSKDVVHCIPIRAPGFLTKRKEYLKDIAAYSGACYISSLAGFNHTQWDSEWFGLLERATVKSKSFTLESLDVFSDQIETRIKEIEAEYNQAISEYDRDRCKERKSKLSGSLCIIKVGGVTESECKERRARIEDALNAIQSALKQGITPGACVNYLTLSTHLGDTLGEDILRKALLKTLELLARNSGLDGPEIVLKTLDLQKENPYVGFDPNKKEFRDVFNSEEPVFDTYLTVKSVLEGAQSICKTLLLTEASICKD
jgi:chaperonin GroEL